MNHNKSNDLFEKSIENFINICETTKSGDYARHGDKLNRILNELNGIDTKQLQICDINRVSLGSFLCGEFGRLNPSLI